MTEPVLIDTGPLVAMLSSKDSANEACRECFSMLRRPPITIWPVLAEAAYLLRSTSNGVAALFGLFRVGAVQLRPLPEESLEWIEGFMKRYSSVGAQLADASLMWLAERQNDPVVFTLDRRDFTVYRLSSGAAVTIVPPLES